MISEERIKSLLQLLKDEPHDPFLNYALALEYYKLGEHSKAINLIETLLVRDENYLGAYLQLGNWYESAGNIEKARNTYTTGTKIARIQGNRKTLSELEEAIFLLDD